MVISINVEKTSDKTQHSFIKKKTLKWLGIQGPCLNKIKTIYDKCVINFLQNGEEFRESVHFSSLLSNIVLSLAEAKLRDRNKGTKIKKISKIPLFADMFFYIVP